MSKVPNILSVLRILTVPFLLFFAWNGFRYYFVGLLIIALLTVVQKIRVEANPEVFKPWSV
jgi:phosphatidylglycerophosphate synthase